MLEITGILRSPSEAWNHKFNLIGVSLTKPRGTIPRGRNDHYVSVALFESSSGERITDAQVSARVSPIGLAGRERDLKPIPIGAAVTYGNFFSMSSPDTYVIEVVIRQMKGGDPIRARFEYRYYRSER